MPWLRILRIRTLNKNKKKPNILFDITIGSLFCLYHLLLCERPPHQLIVGCYITYITPDRITMHSPPPPPLCL